MALYSKKKPLSVTYGLNDKTHDAEGRCITAEYDKFYLVTTCKHYLWDVWYCLYIISLKQLK